MRDRSTATSPERTHTDAAYLGVVENSPFGIYIVDADFKLITISQGAQKVFSAVKNPLGRDFAKVMSVLWPEPFLSHALGHFRHTLATGESYHEPGTVETRAGSGETEAYDWKIERVLLPDSRWAVVCYFYDMTEREQARRQLKELEERQTFLLKLSDTTRDITDPKKVADATVELLARQLGASRCVYGSVDENEVFHLEGEWRHEKLPPMPASLRVQDLGELNLQEGRTVVIHDTGTDERVNEEAFDEMGRMRAAVGVPLVKNGRLMAGFGVLDHKPRQWSIWEVRLIEEVCARTWAAVERARAEEAQRQSEQRLQHMMNMPRVGVLTFNFKGDMLSANDAFLDMVGYGREEFNARTFTWKDFTPDEHVAISERVMEQLRTTGRGGPYEKEYFRKDGSRTWFMFVAADMGDGTIAEYAFDISDRKAAEADVQRSRERYQAFMHHSAEGIWRCELERPMPIDLSTTEMLDFAYEQAYMAECNDAMARMYGYESGKELEGARLADLIPRTPDNEAYLTAFFTNGFKFLGGESAEKHRDGHTVYFSNNLVGIVEDGYVVRVWGTQSDITARKQAEDDIELLASVSVDLVGLGSGTVLSPTTGDRILEHFGLNRLSMGDIDVAADRAEVHYDHHGKGVPGAKGQRTLSAWRASGSLTRLSQGLPHVVNDVSSDGELNAEAYLSIGAAALVTIPVLRDGALVSFFSVTAAEARVWTDADVELLRELAARIWSGFERVKAEQALQHELASTRSLAEVSTSLVHGGAAEGLYVKIVEAASFIMDSQFASMQELDADSGHLKLVASHNYTQVAKEKFRWITPAHNTSCSIALRDGRRTVITDIDGYAQLEGTKDLEVFREAGIRAMQSTPLLTREGKVLGMISTHWDHAHDPPADDLRLFDVLARQAADLIERVGNERLLRESESRFRMATDTGRVGVWEWHIPSDRVTWNDVLYDIQGIKKTEFAGDVEAFTGTVHPEDRERVGSAIQGSLKNDTPYQVEFRAIRPSDRRVIRLVTHARVLRDAGGQPERMVGAVVDITAVREAEEALRAADRRKDEFLATLAHELRNPLAPLRSGLEVLRTSAAEPGTVAEIRAMMDRQVNQMVHLVDDLLDLSRISRGVIELRRAPMDVHQAVHQAVEASKPLLQAKGHKLLLELHMAPLMVDADGTRLTQIFGNLLDNAGKYTDRGTIHLTSRLNDGHAEISIRDTGIGLTPEQVPKVFDMFSQVDRSHTRTRGGLGIGLHIVKRLAEMHGGSISVTSEGLQQGSCFTLRLPLAAVAEGASSGQPKGSSAPPLRVLLTDDNVDAATMLSIVLRKVGHQVAVAHGGEEALLKGAEHKPQVVILDIGMPGIDGYETCRRMRQLDWGKAAYIVALTGWGQSEDRQRSREAGFDHHLVKPVDRAALEEVLATVVP